MSDKDFDEFMGRLVTKNDCRKDTQSLIRRLKRAPLDTTIELNYRYDDEDDFGIEQYTRVKGGWLNTTEFMDPNKNEKREDCIYRCADVALQIECAKRTDVIKGKLNFHHS